MHRILLSTTRKTRQLLCQGQLAQPAVTSPSRQLTWAACMAEHLPQSQRHQGGLHGKRLKSTMAEFADDLETVNEKFVEARDEIEYAQEDAETVYFNESHDAAKEAVSACLDLFSSISSQLDESERGKLQRSMGMKMEQLKEELAQLDTLHD